jgi:acyl dehydratase
MTWPVGHEFPPQSYVVTRADLVRYAGASGDFNPIHWSDRVATSVGLPGVVAHGMFTLALVGRALTEWVGDPGRVVTFGARFTRPVAVPDDEAGTSVQVAGVVTEAAADAATVELTVMHAGQRVLGASRAVVRC